MSCASIGACELYLRRCAHFLVMFPVHLSDLAQERIPLQAGISAFEGWIVNIDSVSQANDLPGNATAAAAAAARPTAAAAADMEVRARLPNQHNEQAQIAVAQQQCKKRPKFQQPRAAVVLPYDNAVMAVTKSQTESAHNPSGLKGGGKPPTSFLYTKPGSKQPVPQCLVQKRSGLCHAHLGVLDQESLYSRL